MKKLCLIIPSLQPGGMERVMSQLAFFFCEKNDLDVHLILFGRDPQIFFKIPDNLTVHQPKSKFNNKFRILSSIGRLWFLRHEVKTIKPDSTLSFGEHWNSFVLLALYGLKYPVYISDRCRPDKDLGRFQDKLRKWLYPKSTGIIAQTSVAREIYQTKFKQNNIRIIGNPIPTYNDFIDQTVKENIVLTVGRLINTKNHDKLIKLFVRINKPGWKLIIVGDDAQKQNQMSRLQTLILKLNADNEVILAGNQFEVKQYYLKSKIFAFTSSSEGFPNVIGEAQSFGLPVIAFDCIAGPSEMICDGQNGFLVPLFDYALFKEKLQLLMDNSRLRIEFGINARKSIKQFSTDYIGQQFYDFLFSHK